jgi:phytoene synthase
MTVTLRAQPADLRGAYETCRRLQRKHDPTFYIATQRLPGDVRPAVYALYGYVRGADEIVDSRLTRDNPERARAALDDWQHVLHQGRAAGISSHPVIAALVDAGRRHDLPLDELDTYMDSMRVDCGRVRIGSSEELARYMDGSAASVGRVMAPLLGAPTAADKMAVLAVGFQLTNFIRDAREDWSMGRIYLPGLHTEDLRGRPATARLRECVADEVDHARQMFADGAAVLDVVTPAVRRGMRVALAVYTRILDRVERIGYDVIQRRPALRPWEIVAAVAGATRSAPAAAG